MDSVSYNASLIERILKCEVCRELMMFPYIMNCGHTFCYGCSYEWLKSHRSCPRCRARIRQKPILVYALKEICDTFIKNSISSSSSSSMQLSCSAQQYNIQLTEQEAIYLRHGDDHFPGLFRDDGLNIPRATIEDAEDRVLRCARCQWEIEGPECLHCGYIFSDAGEHSDERFDDWIADETGYMDDTIEESEDLSADEGDSINSFIVPDGEMEYADSVSSQVDLSNTPCSTSSRDEVSMDRRNRVRIVISSDEDEDKNENENTSLYAGERTTSYGSSNGRARQTNISHGREPNMTRGLIHISDDSEEDSPCVDSNTAQTELGQGFHSDTDSIAEDEEFYGFDASQE